MFFTTLHSLRHSVADRRRDAILVFFVILLFKDAGWGVS
jgi:hypothetical protein